MLGLLISPLIVMFLLWLLARHEAELSYYIIFFVVAGDLFTDLGRSSIVPKERLIGRLVPHPHFRRVDHFFSAVE